MRWLEMKPWPVAPSTGCARRTRDTVAREGGHDVALQLRLGGPAQTIGGLTQVAAGDQDGVGDGHVEESSMPLGEPGRGSHDAMAGLSPC